MKELVLAVRCINCKYYISEKELKNNDMYNDLTNLLEYDGYCSAINIWVDEMGFCSYGTERSS